MKNCHNDRKVIAAGPVCLVSMVFVTWLCVRNVECEPTRVVKFPAVSQKHRFLSD